VPLSRYASAFALWAALWMAISIAAVVTVFDAKFLLRRDGAAHLSLLLLIGWLSIPTLIGAHSLWVLFHRGGYRPGIGGYVLLALLVVLVSHLFGLTAPALLFTGLGVSGVLSMSFDLLWHHGWVTAPMALVTTGLFARWARRRWPTAPPSGPSPARSRS